MNVDGPAGDKRQTACLGSGTGIDGDRAAIGRAIDDNVAGTNTCARRGLNGDIATSGAPVERSVNDGVADA